MTPPSRGAALTAARAETSAAALLQPASGLWGLGLGHLLHMSSHTFVRIGRWHDAAVSNMNAHAADAEDARHCQSPYEPEHNTDMLVYAANMGGEVRGPLGSAFLVPGHAEGPSPQTCPHDMQRGSPGIERIHQCFCEEMCRLSSCS